MVPLPKCGNAYGPSYRPPNIEKSWGGEAHFWGEKFEYANDSSFKRARRAESNKMRINAIGRFWTKL